jgi:hypothetical protein
MQVLCKLSNTVSDVRCKVCGQGFLVYWSRTSRSEQEITRRHVLQTLELHHTGSNAQDAHPRASFNVPDWSATARFLDAPVLSGADDWAV